MPIRVLIECSGLIIRGNGFIEDNGLIEYSDFTGYRDLTVSLVLGSVLKVLRLNIMG